MQPYFNGEAYQNYPRSAQTGYRELYWGKWFPQLLAIKKKYDPDGFFNYAQDVSAGSGNIAAASAPGAAPTGTRYRRRSASSSRRAAARSNG